MDPYRRARAGVAALGVIIVVGSIGYVLLGFSPLDAVYQTVTTVTTVGFREVEEFDRVGKLYTIVLILLGVGTALFTLAVLVEGLVEGQLGELLGRRRMERRIAGMAGHVIVCGYGRVGGAIASFVGGSGREVVLVDLDPERVAGSPYPTVIGDATDDAVLVRAGIDRAQALVGALTSDADNLFVTLSGRAARPDLFIVARARHESSEAKLIQAGANRVVNPQLIGGARMAAFVTQPHVAEFLDVVMHDGSLEFRLGEVLIPPGSPLGGRTLREAHIRDHTGALVLAMRSPSGSFTTNPSPETTIEPGQTLIVVGTAAQLGALAVAALPGGA